MINYACIWFASILTVLTACSTGGATSKAGNWIVLHLSSSWLWGWLGLITWFLLSKVISAWLHNTDMKLSDDSKPTKFVSAEVDLLIEVPPMYHACFRGLGSLNVYLKCSLRTSQQLSVAAGCCCWVLWRSVAAGGWLSDWRLFLVWQGRRGIHAWLLFAINYLIIQLNVIVC